MEWSAAAPFTIKLTMMELFEIISSWLMGKTYLFIIFL